MKALPASRKERRTLVACTGDWHTEAVLEALERDGRPTTFLTLAGNRLAKRRWRHVSTIKLTPPSVLTLAQRVASRFQDFSSSRINYLRMSWFDRQVARRIASGEFGRCFLWAGMAASSLDAAASQDIPAALFLGSTPFFYIAERRASGEVVKMVSAWTADQLREFESATCIWAESRFVARSVRALGVPEERILSLTPPIVFPPFGVECGADRSLPLRCATVQGGRRKGTALLFELWPRLEGKARLEIFGSLEPALRGMQPAGVIHHGHLVPELYRAELARCEVALFPTFADGGPRALFDAMAAGLCPIATANCAAPELILEGETGFLVPVGDVNALETRLHWCLDHRDELRRIGAHAREAVRRHLDPEVFQRSFCAAFFS